MALVPLRLVLLLMFVKGMCAARTSLWELTRDSDWEDVDAPKGTTVTSEMKPNLLPTDTWQPSLRNPHARVGFEFAGLYFVKDVTWPSPEDVVASYVRDGYSINDLAELDAEVSLPTIFHKLPRDTPPRDSAPNTDPPPPPLPSEEFDSCCSNGSLRVLRHI